VIGAGGLTVSRLHGVFGSDKSVSYGDTKNDETKPFNPKHLRYEIFGPPGTLADISYFDSTGDPQSLEGVRLPWSLEFPITAATGVGSIAAQGDSDTIGCRIVVDGVVKAEKTTDQVSAFTSCLLKAA
jgi:MmpS family membrane protein